MPKNPQAGEAWPKLKKPEQIGFLLKSLQHTLRQTLDQALRKQGVELSFAHLSALFGLHADPGITGAQLARRAMVSAQTMSSALRGLETDGYIQRRPHPHSRRADSWWLTSAGRDELVRARRVGSAVFATMLGDLSTAECAAFEDCLHRCITALGGDTPAAVTAPRHRAGKPRWSRATAAGRAS